VENHQQHWPRKGPFLLVYVSGNWVKVCLSMSDIHCASDLVRRGYLAPYNGSPGSVRWDSASACLTRTSTVPTGRHLET